MAAKPKYNPYTHCSCSCSNCERWLEPFELLSTDETDKSVRARIYFATAWQIDRVADGKTFCPDCVPDAQPTQTPPPQAEAPTSEQGRLL